MIIAGGWGDVINIVVAILEEQPWWVTVLVLVALGGAGYGYIKRKEREEQRAREQRRDNPPA